MTASKISGGSVLRASPRPEKGLFYAIGGIENYCCRFSTHQRPKVCWVRRLVCARHMSPAVEWTLWPEGASESLSSAPRSDSWRRRWFCRSMSVNDSESRRSELNISLSVSQADLGPTYCHELFFSFFFQSSDFLNWHSCSQRTVQKYFGGYLWIPFFFLAASRFH